VNVGNLAPRVCYNGHMLSKVADIASLRARFQRGELGAVLWDMDGVLADTLELHFRAFEAACQSLGVPYDPQAPGWGPGMSDPNIFGRMLARAGLQPVDGLLQSLLEVKRAVFSQLLREELHTTPGVRDWLEHLRRRAIPCAIASSSAMGTIVQIANQLQIAGYFAAILSGAHLPVSKPDPGVFLMAAGALRLSPQQCLVIEDAKVGLQAARRAGMACLALATTFPPEELQDADLVLRDLAEIPPHEIF
jgi:HAD superfamily hydrolase (TIGR01509 family)